MFDALLNLLFPRRCLGCGKTGVLACADCLGKIAFIGKQVCPECRKVCNGGCFCGEICGGKYYLDRLLVCVNYGKNQLVRKIVHNFKYKFVEELGNILALIIQTQLIHDTMPEDDLLVPVPSHKRRITFRGFDHIKLLTKLLVKNMDLEFSDCLQRIKFKETQAGLNRKGRLKNMKGTIVCNRDLRGKSVMMVDDVAATCATLNECAKVLKMAGARKVSGIVLARN